MLRRDAPVAFCIPVESEATCSLYFGGLWRKLGNPGIHLSNVTTSLKDNMSSLINADVARDLSEQIKSVSQPFAAACQHLACAMRGRYIMLVEAINDDDAPRALSIVERIRESDLVTGISARFHDMREKVHHLVEQLGPFMRTVMGLSFAAVGALIFGEMAILGLLLIVGGFLMALSGLPRQMSDRVIRMD